MTVPNKWLLNVLIGLDETVHAFFGGRPQETISGCIGRGLIDKRWWAPPCCFIVNGLLGPTHCQTSAEIEGKRRAADEAAGAPI